MHCINDINMCIIQLLQHKSPCAHRPLGARNVNHAWFPLKGEFTCFPPRRLEVDIVFHLLIFLHLWRQTSPIFCYRGKLHSNLIEYVALILFLLVFIFNSPPPKYNTSLGRSSHIFYSLLFFKIVVNDHRQFYR